MIGVYEVIGPSEERLVFVLLMAGVVFLVCRDLLSTVMFAEYDVWVYDYTQKKKNQYG